MMALLKLKILTTVFAVVGLFVNAEATTIHVAVYSRVMRLFRCVVQFNPRPNLAFFQSTKR